MQSFIVGLLLAGVSAITFVAFKHPNGYARLFPYLIGLATALFVGITIWQIAVDIVWANMNGLLRPESLAEANSAKNSLSLPYLWIALSYASVAAFLWVNLKLPAFLKQTDEHVSPEKKSSN